MLRRCLFFLLIAFLTSVPSETVCSQSPGEHVLRADAVDPALIRRYKDNLTCVLGRVMETREVGGMTSLIMDGGALHISVLTEKDAKWEGKLIESTGMIEATPPAKAGAPELPPFRMLQLSKRGIRVIPETPESGRSVLIQRTQPTDAPTGRIQPPGTKPDDTALDAARVPFTQSQAWLRNNGQKATVAFSGWRYRQRTGADRKTMEWAVEMYAFNTGQGAVAYYLPEDLDLTPQEAERLRLSLWVAALQVSGDKKKPSKPQSLPESVSLYPNQKGMPTPAQELADTAEWEEKLKTWGETPLKQELQKIYRLPGPADFGNVPDLRQPTFVKLLKPSSQGRTEGTLVLLDWAMTGEPGSTKVTAKVRWSDGVEDTVKALSLAPDLYLRTQNHSGTFTQYDCPLIFFKDWVSAKQRKETLPGAELKIRAMRQFLRVWWNGAGVAFSRDTGQLAAPQKAADMAAANAKEVEDAHKEYRFGSRLSFPGLPPAGFMEPKASEPDRTLMVPQVLEKTKFVDESLAVCHSVIFNWWDAAGVLALPAKGGFKRNPDSLLKYFMRNNVQMTMLPEYAEKYLDKQFKFQLTVDRDYSPANLARYTIGRHGVILTICLWEGRKTQFVQNAALISASPDGAVSFCAWGRKVDGVLKVTDLHGDDKRPNRVTGNPAESYELEITAPADVVEMVKKRGFRLVMDNWQGGSIMVITPYPRDPAAVPPADAKKP